MWNRAFDSYILCSFSKDNNINNAYFINNILLMFFPILSILIFYQQDIVKNG